MSQHIPMRQSQSFGEHGSNYPRNIQVINATRNIPNGETFVIIGKNIAGYIFT
ncbi:hypothetical protein [Sporomusa sp. KB1]|uniref:hypothetical protein n=1 Tax=Sporomusa sp. KB1 TaxID=943346 RepID=UPI0016460F58|nr:hypothetical protein [Sporomusa sp. KB1]